MRLDLGARCLFGTLALLACTAPRSAIEVERHAVLGCPARSDVLPPMDVVIAIDTSLSTLDPSGFDIDGDGRLGEFRSSNSSDREDSLLAAEVEAVRRVLQLATGPDVRFAIVSFSGRNERPFQDSTARGVQRRDAVIRAPLTRDVAVLEAALEQILRRGSNGSTFFSSAMKLALRVLETRTDDAPAAGRVLLLSDSFRPVRPTPGGRSQNVFDWQDPRMRLAAKRAYRAGITFDTFALGEAAEAEVPNTLSRIAGATRGRFYAVSDLTRLHCGLLAAIHQPRNFGHVAR